MLANITVSQTTGNLLAFDRLVQVLFQMGERERLMSFLTGYFDESGTHDTASHLVVAGFVAEADEWTRFVSDWFKILEAELKRDELLRHLVQTEPEYGGQFFFKSQWFDERKKFFRHWGDDKERRQAFMGSLLNAIQNLKPVPVSSALPMSQYEAIVPSGGTRNIIGSGYKLCSMQCLLLAGKWATRSGHSEPIKYIFDAGHRNAKEFFDAHHLEWTNDAVRVRYLLDYARTTGV